MPVEVDTNSRDNRGAYLAEYSMTIQSLRPLTSETSQKTLGGLRPRHLHLKTFRIIAIAVLPFLVGCRDGSITASVNGSGGQTQTTPAQIDPVEESEPRFDTSRGKVLNGSEQPEAASPQMIRLELTLADGSFASCSGVVVAPGKVLTAGHCVTPAKEITAFTQGAAYATAAAVIAPGYLENPMLGAVFNDAAILTVPGLKAPALPLLVSSAVTPDETLSVFGFGLDEQGASGTLKFGSTAAAIVTPNHIFGAQFDGGNVNPCFGDSGGPLLATRTAADGSLIIGIVGVVSSGTVVNVDQENPSCDAGDVTLYTNLQNPALAAFISANAPGAAVL
jgi:hypothetical protein